MSYNTREMTLECMRSIVRETRDTSYEIIVVDNQSSDGSPDAIAEEFPEVRLIRSEDNLGFARANNVAAKEAAGEKLLLLNPDTVVLDCALDRLAAFAEERPEAGIWGGRTLFADRSLNPTSCWGSMTLWSLFCATMGLTALFPSSEIFNSEAYGSWQRDSVREVGIVTGCLLLIRRGMWEELGGFDPVYFMYGEEADLCLRARRLGARPMINPEATIIHYGSASDPDLADKKVSVLTAKITIIRQHWHPLRRGMGQMLFLLSPLTRALGYSLAAWVLRRENLVSRSRFWRDVWSRRGHWIRGYDAG